MVQSFVIIDTLEFIKQGSSKTLAVALYWLIRTEKSLILGKFYPIGTLFHCAFPII